ncbi:hypothetical protein D3C87_1667910 [compost metagenome]
MSQVTKPPPLTRRAPSDWPMSMYFMSCSSCACETTGPISVPDFSAWPTLIDFMRSAMASTNLSWIPAVTIKRLDAVQRWPVE